MEDFQAINTVIENSIRNSSYISVLISSGVFICYNLINKSIDYFKSKDKNKPLYEMAEAIKQVSANVVMLNSVLNKTLNDAEKKETAKIKNIISLVFSSYYNNIVPECCDMITNNHIEENKELILENISKIVTSEYYKIHSILSNYELNGINLSNKLDKSWIEETINSIIGIMYNGQDSMTRIAQLSNRIKVQQNSYTTHLYNKVFTN